MHHKEKRIKRDTFELPCSIEVLKHFERMHERSARLTIERRSHKIKDEDALYEKERCIERQFFLGEMRLGSSLLRLSSPPNLFEKMSRLVPALLRRVRRLARRHAHILPPPVRYSMHGRRVYIPGVIACAISVALREGLELQ